MTPAPLLRKARRVRERLAQARTVPTIATAEVLARTTGGLYLTGGVVGLLATFGAGRWTRADLPAIRGIAVLAMLVGPIVLRFGTRLPRWAYHGLVAAGTGLITLLVLLGRGGDPSVTLAIIYAFAIVDASFFFGVVGLACHLALVSVASAVSMLIVGLPLADIVLLQGVLLVVSVVVAWLGRVAGLAEQDPVTGLANRRGFDRRLETELARVQRDHGRLALVLLDVDDFKGINDHAGHLGGDQVLHECGQRWRTVVPEEHMLSRYGGDEFAVLLPGCSLGHAADVADRLRAKAPQDVTVSAGVAAWVDGDTPSVLLGRADVALYDAKSAGRDQTVVYGDPARSASELEAAISAGELVLHFQPVVRLADSAIVSSEALVRWNHPRRGLVPPADFIPQAERNGAIHALGLWTLQRACASLALSDREVAVSVNVSMPELSSRDYVDAVHQVLLVHGLRPERLTLEITEALFDEDHPQVLRSLDGLRELGVRLAIDDFGTGYSSLRWLEEFPVDIVKIDQSFVAAIDPVRERQPMLSAIMAMCRSLGMRVVAEGVETAEQAEVLRELGCDYAQGYLYGRPVPLEQLPRPRTAPAP